MKRMNFRDILLVFAGIVIFCMLMQGWEGIISFLGIALSSVVPLLLGTGIAYVVSIPTRFFMRHFFPNSTSGFVAAIRRPVCLFFTVVILVAVIVVTSSVLIPALIETVTMVQRNGQRFIEGVIQVPPFKIVREPVQNFLNSDTMQSLKEMDIPAVVHDVFGGTMGTVTSHVFNLVSVLMTGFFGLVFAFILLTDTSNVPGNQMRIIAEYLGYERAHRLSVVMGIANNSFHSYIVRQSTEAMILGTVGTITLLVGGFPYALGVGALMGLAALVPIVGYPIGLFVGAFMVIINNLWLAFIYVAVVATAQILESTFLLPHIGDPRTALTPMWVMVGVTIGGGIAGFVGMLLAIPITSTIRQIIMRDVDERQRKRRLKEKEAARSAVPGKAVPSPPKVDESQGEESAEERTET